MDNEFTHRWTSKKPKSRGSETLRNSVQHSSKIASHVLNLSNIHMLLGTLSSTFQFVDNCVSNTVDLPDKKLPNGEVQ